MSQTLETPDPPSPATLARLRSEFAQVPVGSVSTSTAEKTDPDKIWEAVHAPNDSGDDASRLEVIDRLPNDPQLALEWRLAAALGPIESEHEDALPNAAEAVPLQPKSALPLAVGIGLAAAAALGLWLARANPAEPADPLNTAPAWRAQDQDALLHTALSVDDPLPRTDFRLQWSSQAEDATSFSLRVTTQELIPVFEQQSLTGTEALVPATALATVPSGTVLLWRVEAVEPNGRRHPSPVWEIAVE